MPRAFVLIAALLTALFAALPGVPAAANGVRIYRIESADGHVSWAYPSFHLPDERVIRPSMTLFDRVNRLVIEADVGEIEKHPEKLKPYILNPQPLDLAALFTPQELEVIRARARCNGMFFGIERLRPLFIEMMVGLPCPKPGAEPFERTLEKEAETRGYPVVALEDADEEFKALFAVPESAIIAEIKKYAGHPETASDLYERLIAIYNRGDYDALYRFTVESLPKDAASRQAFIDKVLLERNRHMVERMAPLLAQGKALVVVGAAHFPGKDGIVDLLQHRGFKVTLVETD